MKTSGRRSWACLFRATRIELVAEVPTPGFAFDIASVSVQTDAAVSFSSFIGDNTQEALAAAIRALWPRDRARLDGAYRLAVDDPAPVGARVFREEQQVAFLPDDDGEPTALEEFFQEKEASMNAPLTALPFSSASSSSTGLPRRRRSKSAAGLAAAGAYTTGHTFKGPPVVYPDRAIAFLGGRPRQEGAGSPKGALSLRRHGASHRTAAPASGEGSAGQGGPDAGPPVSSRRAWSEFVWESGCFVGRCSA